MTADLGRVLTSLGVDAGGLAELMRLSPQQQFDALEAAGSVEKVGEEEIGGVKTAHLRGTVKLSDFLNALPADRRRRAERAIRQLERLPGRSRRSRPARL